MAGNRALRAATISDRVIDADRGGLGDEGQSLRDRGGATGGPRHRDGLNQDGPRRTGNCPIVPMRFGDGQSWPIITICRPFWSEWRCGLDMDLGHQRAGGIDEQTILRDLGGFGGDGLGDAVGGEDTTGRSAGAVGEALRRRHRPFGAQAVDDVFVVDDFMADVDRCAVFFDRDFDDLMARSTPAQTRAGRPGKGEGWVGHGGAFVRTANGYGLA